MLSGFWSLAAATVLGLAAVSISATSSDATRSSSRFPCEAFGAGDTDLSAQYEERIQKKGSRAEFRAEFETSTMDGFSAGQLVVFSIDTVVVGTVPLGSGAAGQLGAELRLDSTGHGRGNKKPFPPAFPVIQAGSVLEASVGGTRVIGCLLL